MKVLYEEDVQPYREYLLRTSSNYLERIQKGTGYSVSYQMCHHEMKDLLHIVRDFPAATQAWIQIMPAYKYAILSFEMVSSELVEDPQITNLGVVVIGPEIGICEKELINTKVQAPRLRVGNRFMKYYVLMGYEITSTLEFENPNEY
ncbi:hypothetical protein Goklo_011670 [Gossypium klotzschianum]|uniref:Uncharacterized protein n=1 Tax=Gossypium klotzschianum TaxID=34286 RepID=A0A7J8V9S7_9ROSI|nr:hypothetical protein [Gossypium klotzschianum]